MYNINMQRRGKFKNNIDNFHQKSILQRQNLQQLETDIIVHSTNKSSIPVP